MLESTPPWARVGFALGLLFAWRPTWSSAWRHCPPPSVNR